MDRPHKETPRGRHSRGVKQAVTEIADRAATFILPEQVNGGISGILGSLRPEPFRQTVEENQFFVENHLTLNKLIAVDLHRSAAMTKAQPSDSALVPEPPAAHGYRRQCPPPFLGSDDRRLSSQRQLSHCSTRF
jgi:hypothetical protein